MRTKPTLKDYFFREKKLLFEVTITGIFYNIGMVAGPWFEGRLVQGMYEFSQGQSKSMALVSMGLFYVLTILLVQWMRYQKRLYVRKYANRLRFSMKEEFNTYLLTQQIILDQGEVMTRGNKDIEACVEGMRKFLTEIFDTGVVLLVYLSMLFYYDPFLSVILVCLLPIPYLVAGRMKKTVMDRAVRAKEEAEILNTSTYERIKGEEIYRAMGLTNCQNRRYEKNLLSYERASGDSLIVENALRPLYQVLSMLSLLIIFYWGGKNVLHTGKAFWDIGTFTTYTAVFLKMATKSSKAAKLVGSLQKANVSWKRIVPYMGYSLHDTTSQMLKSGPLVFDKVSFGYDGTVLFHQLSFSLPQGEWLAVAGPVASGKSAVLELLTQKRQFKGKITYGGEPICQENQKGIGFVGHELELFSGTVEENIRLGRAGSLDKVLQVTCLDEDVANLTEGCETKIKEGGVRLSGGQRARVALARELFGTPKLLLLDDPFASVDQKTEEKIIHRLKTQYPDMTVVWTAHRLSSFDQADLILFMGQQPLEVKDHKTMLKECSAYKKVWKEQSEKEQDGKEKVDEIV